MRCGALNRSGKLVAVNSDREIAPMMKQTY
jgi:hypothetical protein